MPTRANLPPWQRWLLLYLGAVALGSFVLFSEGLFPQTWFSGWAWWHRLALILFVGPFVVVGGIAGYALCEGIVEAAIHATTYALKEHTLPTLIGLVALVSLILAGVGLLSG